jgi:RAMP superfamily
MLLVRATLKTEAPLSIALPVAEGARANDYGQFPVMTRGVDEDGNKLETGYLPATTLRGFLRRAAVLPDMKAAAEAGKHYRLPKAYAELIGQDAESEKSAGDIDLVALRESRDSSPVLDLFGSGLGIKSRLLVSHFLPSVNVLPEVFTGVRKDLDDNEQAFDLVADTDQEQFLGRSESNNKRAEASKLAQSIKRKLNAAKKRGEDTAEIEKEMAAAEALAEKYKASMGDMQNSSRTIVQHHALPSGLELTGKLVIQNEKDRDIDLLLRGMDALSQFPILGAQSARGCGEVSGTFDFYKEGILVKRVVVGDYQPAKITDFSGSDAAA